MNAAPPQAGETGLLDRRVALALLAGAAIAPNPAFAAEASLAGLARRKGMRFGTIIGTAPIGEKIADIDDPAYRALVARQCTLLVPENELKMGFTWQAPDRFEFAPADRVMAFARSAGLPLRGHTLIWNDNYTPKWLLAHDFGSSAKAKAERMLRGYIRAVTGHFGDRVTSWDVINEAVDPETGSLRSTVFTRILGPAALRIAFEAAREVLPYTELVYNDFMCWARAGEKHRAGVLALLRSFRDARVPVDALGIQSHLGLGFDLGDADPAAWKSFLDSVTGLDFRLLVTELDVNDGGLPADPKVRDAEVAQAARRYLDQLFDYKQLRDVIVWGLVDKYSWIQAYLPRDDRLPSRPTPYASDFAPKPLRAAIANAFRTAPAR